jgi:uncharacterized protein (TIGR02680 family)
MNDSLFSNVAPDDPAGVLAPAHPSLPEPQRGRWQPLRIGLVDLFHYDSEEFWFHDGHLLLRGNNGTGKSKVLSLTLPFLFDASLKSSRIEPDGDPGKKMAWNLLLGKHERRTGYAWIEFGRIGRDGAADFLTLGCGMAAVAARPQVDHWFFMTEGRRIGRDLWLMTPQRTVLGKERLGAALGERGRVFETAAVYRRAVDERLFHLGEARYGALMDTLIQLRQPQLSKKPNEDTLSNALTEALPPLPDELLNDVADAMGQLEEYGAQLGELAALGKAIGRFNSLYQAYARVNARRQAQVLRSAQTGFDKASRELNEARTGLEVAAREEAAQRERLAGIETRLAADRAALDEMLADPLMQDANRLGQLTSDAQARRVDAQAAQARLDEAVLRQLRGREELDAITARAGVAREALAAAHAQSERLAQDAGLHARGAWRRADVLADADALAAMPEQDLGALQHRLRELARARRSDLALVEKRLREEDTAGQRSHAARLARDERADVLANAAEALAAAEAMLAAQGETLAQAWQDHFAALRELAPVEPAAVLAVLGDWCASPEGDNPARRALEEAQQDANVRLAELEVDLRQRQGVLERQRQALEEERAALARGDEQAPPAPSHRAADARPSERPGAPLWQLVDFRTDRQWRDGEQAGLEAALEASGLLDAWVEPDGTVAPAGAYRPDTFLVARPPQTASLADWLAPAAGGRVDAARIAGLLRAIACGTQPAEGAEAWVAPDGRFRLGPLAGAWNKRSAEYVGAASRAEARRKRLAVIVDELEALARALAEAAEQQAGIALRRARAQDEWRAAPSDEDLRKAHLHAGAAEQQRRQAAQWLAQAEEKLAQADSDWRAAREQLQQDAADLGLPADATALERAGAALDEFQHALHQLLLCVAGVRGILPEQARQDARVAELGRDVVQAQELTAQRRVLQEEVEARLASLRARIGDQVGALERRLASARSAVAQGEGAFRKAGNDLGEAGKRLARGEQRAEDAAATLAERTAQRQDAAQRLEQFHATGLLAVALPELESAPLPWSVDGALGVARRAEQALQDVEYDDNAWSRVQSAFSQHYTELLTALTALGHQAQAETSDFGMIVTVIYQNRPQRPDLIEASLREEVAQRRALLTARETEVLENHLQAEVAAAIQRMLREAEQRRHAINAELEKRPTSTGVRFRLDWQPLPEGPDGAPVGLDAARKRLLNTSFDVWSAEDRQVVGSMLQNRISAERSRMEDEGGSLLDMLSRALDYRRWHRFRVQRWQDGQWRPLSGPASSGERALGLTVPLFAAVSSFYTHGGSKDAPRLVLLDEAFAGIDDAARAHCMALVREFDLDFVMTSEREWACYAELPGVSICQLQRREGIDAVHVSRWRWDGLARRPEEDGVRRFPPPDAVPL